MGFIKINERLISSCESFEALYLGSNKFMLLASGVFEICKIHVVQIDCYKIYNMNEDFLLNDACWMELIKFCNEISNKYAHQLN